MLLNSKEPQPVTRHKLLSCTVFTSISNQKSIRTGYLLDGITVQAQRIKRSECSTPTKAWLIAYSSPISREGRHTLTSTVSGTQFWLYHADNSGLGCSTSSTTWYYSLHQLFWACNSQPPLTHSSDLAHGTWWRDKSLPFWVSHQPKKQFCSFLCCFPTLANATQHTNCQSATRSIITSRIYTFINLRDYTILE